MSHQPCSQLTRTPQNMSHTHNTHHHHTPSRDVEVPLKKTQSPQCAASSLAPPKATRGPQKLEQNVQSPKMGLLWTAVSVRDHPKTSAVAPLQPERAKRMCTRKRTEKTPERACAANVHKVLAQLDVQPHQQRDSNDPSPRRAPLSVARDFLFRFAHFWTTARAGSTSLRAPIVVVSNTATSAALVSNAHAWLWFCSLRARSTCCADRRAQLPLQWTRTCQRRPAVKRLRPAVVASTMQCGAPTAVRMSRSTCRM